MTPSRQLTSFSRVLLRQSSRPVAVRPLSTSAPRSAVTKNPNTQHDAQHDRHKMNTEANEYAKSGTDNAAANQEEAAFEKGRPDPQDAKKKAGEGTKVNPLDASPANPEISKGTSRDPTQ